METTRDMAGDLVAQILTIAHDQLTGTLRVTGPAGASKQVFFHQGAISDIDTGRDDTLLEAALLETGLFSEKDLKQARRRAAKAQVSVGAALLDTGLVTDEAAGESIRVRLTEEIIEAFGWQVESFSFVAHEANERLEDFRSELCEFYEVVADPEDVVIEAAKRLGRWDLVQLHFGMLADVLYATPASFIYFRDAGQYPTEHAILGKLDGVKDVEEAIQESGVDPFQAFGLIRRLKAQGEVELINPVQMFQLGVDFASNEKHEKASRLFRRARDRGLDDFDIQLRIAQSLDALGQKEEALRGYLDFADRCLGQLRLDDATRSLKRATQLEPGCLPAQEKYLKLLLEQNRTSEAVEQAIAVAQYLRSQGEPRKGLDLLLKVRTLQPKELRLQQKIIEFAEANQDFQTARAERELLAKTSEEKKDIEVALDVYQRMFCEGNDSLEVRMKLVELHRAKGNGQKALEHATAILSLPEKIRPRDEATLLELNEVVRALKPSDIRSNRWLSEYYGKKGDRAKAAEVLTCWIASLDRDGDTYELVHAYEALLQIDDRYEHRWGLAQVLEKMGRAAESRRELRSVANLAIRRKEFDAAAKALEHILRTSPLDLETHKMQCELQEARNDADGFARRLEDFAILNLLAGNVQEAEPCVRRLDSARPEAPEVIRRLGRLCLEQGDHQKGAEQLVKAAKLHLQQRNFGLCNAALRNLLDVQPGHSEGLALFADLKAREVAPLVVAQAAPPASPRASPSPTPAAPGAPEAHAAHPEPAIFEPIQPIKTSVTNITARLRRLKLGDAEDPQRRTAPAAEAPPAQGAAEPGNGSENGAKPAASSAALRSAAARLKALAGRKAQDSDAGPGDGAEAGAALGGAAAAVPTPTAAGGAAQPGSPPGDGGTPTAPMAFPATAGGNGAAGVPAGDGVPPPVTTKKLKLASSASRLAALRGAAAKA